MFCLLWGFIHKLAGIHLLCLFMYLKRQKTTKWSNRSDWDDECYKSPYFSLCTPKYPIYLSVLLLSSLPLLGQQQTLSCRHLFLRPLRLSLAPTLFLFRSHRLIKCSEEKNSWLGSLCDFLFLTLIFISATPAHKINIVKVHIWVTALMAFYGWFFKNEDTDVFVFIRSITLFVVSDKNQLK